MSVDAVLKFWLDEVDQSSWYSSAETLDQKIRDRFLETWHQIMEGRSQYVVDLSIWCLGLIFWSRINFRAICFADRGRPLPQIGLH
jgi:uncharacterized protein (DUF924 family)